MPLHVTELLCLEMSWRLSSAPSTARPQWPAGWAAWPACPPTTTTPPTSQSPTLAPPPPPPPWSRRRPCPPPGSAGGEPSVQSGSRPPPSTTLTTWWVDSWTDRHRGGWHLTSPLPSYNRQVPTSDSAMVTSGGDRLCPSSSPCPPLTTTTTSWCLLTPSCTARPRALSGPYPHCPPPGTSSNTCRSKVQWLYQLPFASSF